MQRDARHSFRSSHLKSIKRPTLDECPTNERGNNQSITIGYEMHLLILSFINVNINGRKP